MDQAIARGELHLGPFAGVPVVVKESFGVAGRPCTWAFLLCRTPAAIIVGATNVPFQLTDGQTFNAIYGTTNKPWALTRTPGGSSGGTAAALAAGLGFLGIGSPRWQYSPLAHCCGIFGHKPALDIAL